MSKLYRVSKEIIKYYELEVEADNEDDAEALAVCTPLSEWDEEYDPVTDLHIELMEDWDDVQNSGFSPVGI